MSKFNLNFEKFKKIGSDKHATTLRHPDGHEVKIAHSSLSPKHREMLASLPVDKLKMADGGSVEETQQQEPSLGDKIKQSLMDAKDRLQKANEDYLNQQKQLFGLGPEHISDEEKQAIATQMGMNTAMGTISSPYSKVPVKEAAERMIPAAEKGYAEASKLFNAAEQGAANPAEAGMRPAPLQQMPKSNATPMQQVQRQMNKAGGKRYADGGTTQPEPQMIEEQPNEAAPTMVPGAEQAPNAQDRAMWEATLNPKPGQINQLTDQDSMDKAVAEQTANAEDNSESEQPQQEAPIANKPESADSPADDASLSMNPTAGYQEQLQGLQEQYKAEKDMAALKQADIQSTINQQQKSLGYLNQASQDYKNEWDKIAKEIDNNQINPDDYWKNHSRVMSTIGIILGGFNPTSSPNAPAEMLKYRMDENMRAQLANLNSKHNLIAASAAKYGNLRQGIEAANILQTQMLAHKLELSSQKVADPAARAKMLQLSGQLKLQAAPQIMRFNVMQGAMNAQQNGDAGHYLQAMRFVDPAMAKELESRFVPDANNPNKGDFASIPIPEKSRDEMTARASLQEQAHALRQWSAQHSGELRAMNPADVNYGQALASSLQDAYRRANGQGVFREAEANFVKGIVSDDPTAFFNQYRTDPKYRALEDTNLMQLNGLRKGYGLQPKGAEIAVTPQTLSALSNRTPNGPKPTNSLTPQQLIELARRMPNDPKAKMFLKTVGVE